MQLNATQSFGNYSLKNRDAYCILRSKGTPPPLGRPHGGGGVPRGLLETHYGTRGGPWGPCPPGLQNSALKYALIYGGRIGGRLALQCGAPGQKKSFFCFFWSADVKSSPMAINAGNKPCIYNGAAPSAPPIFYRPLGLRPRSGRRPLRGRSRYSLYRARTREQKSSRGVFFGTSAVHPNVHPNVHRNVHPRWTLRWTLGWTVGWTAEGSPPVVFHQDLRRV